MTIAQTYFEWSPIVNTGVVIAALAMMGKGVSQWTRIEDALKTGSSRMDRIEGDISGIRSDTKQLPALVARVENLERAVGRLETKTK